MAPNTWRAYRSDLADFATWVAYTSAEWRAPEVVATYLRTLEDGGAAYATITRRLTSIHKLVAIAAIAAGDLDYEDPTKHPRVGVTLQAIRRRLSTDQDQANPLTSQRLLQVLLWIDTATAAGMRDVALLLVGWYGALRRSELAGLERDHLSLEGEGLVLQLPRSKASPDHSVWVPIADQPDSDWNPTARLEDWLEAAARLRPTATDAVWLHVTRGDTVTRDAPITAAAINNMVQRRASAAEFENFLHFWDWLDTLITSCTRAGASMLAYCWHQAAENTQLRRIARHSPTLKSRVDSFISSGEWVDLERIFKAGWITGGSTGLKAIAPLAGFSWDIDNPGGAIAMFRYTEAAAGSTVAQAWLTNYNRGDVEATLAIGCSAASGRADQAGSPVGHFGLGPSQSGVGPTTAGRFFAHSISHGRGVPLPAHETRLLVCGSMTAETGSPSGQRSAGWRRPIRWPTSWVTR